MADAEPESGELVEVNVVGATRPMSWPVEDLRTSQTGLLVLPRKAQDRAEFFPWSQIASLYGSEDALRELFGTEPRGGDLRPTPLQLVPADRPHDLPS
jgi:hypothetical protein